MNTTLTTALLFFAATALTINAAESPLIITEVMASNRETLRDEDGDASDWLEIYNQGRDAVVLEGYALTDDPENPNKWPLPPESLNPGEFKIIFASGKNRNQVGRPLHANFKLSRDGEYLALVNTETERALHAFSPAFPKIAKNYSFGLSFTGSQVSQEAPGTLAEPTPGAPNPSSYAPPRTADTKFNIDRGFYEQPFEVYLRAATPDAIIHFTLDGSTPSPEHGQKYVGPIPIDKTSILRAMAFKEGYLPSNVDTHTYIFVKDVIAQPAGPPEHWESLGSRFSLRGRRVIGSRINVNGQMMSFGMAGAESMNVSEKEVVDALTSIPSISLVTDHEHLFGRSGIYVNARQRGRSWERPVSVELIDPSGEEEGFQIDAGIRIRGGHSRQPHCPKHAFRIYFRDEYGPGKLKYALFGDEGAASFDDVDLRTPQNYSYHYNDDPAQNTFLREVFSRDCQRDLGQPYTRSRYYHLYLNGAYWGLFQTQEHAEASYAATYFGGRSEDYDVVKADWGRRTEVTDGDWDAWLHLWQTANQIAAHPGAEERLRLYRQLQGLDAHGERDSNLPIYLDVDNLTDYMIIVFLIGSFDAPVSNFMSNERGNNWFGIRHREGKLGFQFFCHDTEHCLASKPEMAAVNRVGPFPAGQDVETSNPQWIHQQLLSVDAYREQFAARAESLLLNEGPLSLENNLRRLNARARQVEKTILGECARWGAQRRRPGFTKSDWLAAVDRVRESLHQRASIVPDQLRTGMRYARGNPFEPLVGAPLFNPIGFPIVHRRENQTLGFSAPTDAPGLLYYTLDGRDPKESDGTPLAEAAMADPRRSERHVLLASDAPIKAFPPLERDANRAWTHPDFDARGWLTGRGGVGYDRNGDYASMIGVDVQRYMYRLQTSVYTRSEFDLDSLEHIDGLTLRMKFEDGFVAYLNGEPIYEWNAPRVRQWNSAAQAQRNDGLAMQWAEFDVSEFRTILRPGKNVLAIHGMNDRPTSSDLLILPELIGLESREGTAVPIDPSVETIQARIFFKGNWSPLIKTRLRNVQSGAKPSADVVTISEIMYHPAPPSDAEKQAGFEDPDDFEFIELMNVGKETIDLAGCRFTNGIDFTFQGPFTLEPGARCVLVRTRGAFETRYGNQARVAGNYTGGLKNSGERVTFDDTEGSQLASVSFRDDTPWPQGADGVGFSIVLVDPESRPDLDNAENWQASNALGGSPGAGDTASSGGVLINEVLVHTDWPLVDAIELHNPTEKPIDISGWFLTDNRENPQKYPIVAGTVVPAGGYLVISEDNDADLENNAGLPPEFFGRSFSLSSHGEEVYLFAAEDGKLSGYSHGLSFEASENAVSYGRHLNSEGKEQFPPQKELTLGKANSVPRERPVVISEIHYHPLNDDDDAEFVEIWNRSKERQPLFDPQNPENTWQLSGVRFTFPPGQTLEPHEAALIIKSDAETFRRRFKVPASVKIFGPFEAVLSNKGERVRLLRPDIPDVTPEETVIPMLEVDSVRYNDKEPWPEDADGTGVSLERKPEASYSDDPESWRASEQDGGTPGKVPGHFEPKVSAAEAELQESSITSSVRESPAPRKTSVSSSPSEDVQEPSSRPLDYDRTTKPIPTDAISRSASKAVWGGIFLIGVVTLIPLIRRMFR